MFKGVPVLLLIVSSLSAAPLPIVEYFGRNGDNSYRDNSYTGSGGGTGYGNLTGGTGDLTDNVASTNFTDPTWVGWNLQNSGFSKPVMRFDLGDLYGVEQVEIDLAHVTTALIRAPSQIELRFSVDGVTYTDPVVYIPPVPGSNTVYRTDTITFNRIARYVSIETTYWSDTTDNWIFYNNIRFEGKVPEPGSLGLVAAGAALAAMRRTRKRR